MTPERKKGTRHMSDISDLENRISAAMDRISRGLETIPAPGQAADQAADREAVRAADQAVLDGMRDDLADEKLANAQLRERLGALSSRIEDLERSLETARDALEQAVDAREAAVLAQTTARAEIASAEAGRAAAQEAAQQAEAAREELREELDAAREALQEQTRSAARPVAQVIDLDASRDVLTQFERRLGRVRHTSRQLRGANQQLREAAEGGLSDPHLINQSLLCELNNLKAVRAAEMAEMDVITSALRPLLDESGSDAADDAQTGGKADG